MAPVVILAIPRTDSRRKFALSSRASGKDCEIEVGGGPRNRYADGSLRTEAVQTMGGASSRAGGLIVRDWDAAAASEP